ncbi:phospholipase effector Tle1 domain-containing protein [Dyadobacter sandarakinus]|uniref:DUF2235 domain-containing protein n=1 Tax=Dyadobacter sandarakinus TaxID=2747268 RepID=A0ABX7I5M7_9BACT|nr:DUF2235 domain-containing protein [Dyadobacter sandarakinus]QRR01404.1 DUF2235 domain-containing protein [Dyadobacter sandarakinus]
MEQMRLGKYCFLNVQLGSKVKAAYHALSIDENRKAFLPTLWEKSPDAPSDQILSQVWFAGVHCNVGGGYADSGLSDNALLWMIDKASKNHNLKFNKTYLHRRVNADSFYGEMRDERRKWNKKLIYTPASRSIIDLCAKAHIDVVIAESAYKRTLSDICKVKYMLSDELINARREPRF